MSESTCVLSIIVPVYNVEKYLRDCLDSLLMQDLAENEYEIICVDDGSKDSSPAILDEYAENHANIRVIHKQNGGVSSARNVGIEAAKGEYLWFVDSDDCIAPNCLGKICHLLCDYHPQIVKLDWDVVNDDYSFADLREYDKADDSEFEVHDNDLSFNFKGLIRAAWGFIISKDLILKNNLRFREDMKYAEDVLLVFEVFMRVKEVWLWLHHVVYLYRQRTTSAIHDVTPSAAMRRYYDRFKQINTIRSYWNSEYLQDRKLLRAVKSYVYKQSYMLLHECVYTCLDYQEIARALKENHIIPLRINWAFVFDQRTLKEKVLVLRNCVFFRFVPLYRIFFNKLRKKQRA